MYISLICIISLSATGQSSLGIEIVSGLPKSRIYFVGQLHNNEANTMIETELLLSLHTKFNVQYNILENSHSAAFLINHYLQTGNESILKFVNPDAKFQFIKTVKAYNDKISSTNKIRFYGIDFENRQHGKYIRKVFEIICNELPSPVTEPLISLLQNLVECRSDQLEGNLLLLKNFLKTNEVTSRTLLGKYYVDVLLIANAQFNFSSKRDKAMISNFVQLYNELSKEGICPGFFASFGTGHINPENNNGIVMKLMNDHQSPVKNNVCIIGIQYFNCLFGKEKIHKSTDGSLRFLCKNSVAEEMFQRQDYKSKRIEFLPKSKLSLLTCSGAIQLFAGIILVSNYGSSSYWTWE